MGQMESWIDQVVRAGRVAYFAFKVDKSQRGFKISFDGRVEEEGKDLHFMLMTFDDYRKWSHWISHSTVIRHDSKGKVVRDANGYPVYDDVPEPTTTKYANDRTNRFKETFVLDAETYALVFNNRYSQVTDKTLWLGVSEKWEAEEPTKALPIVEQLKREVPEEVLNCLTKASESYGYHHYEQSSVMFRKAIDFAIKIKLLQSGVGESELMDSDGNELSLSRKLSLLREKNLITRRTSKDLDQVKWFGDIGAHGQMKIAESDIRENVEPKVRSFLVGLNLKA